MVALKEAAYFKLKSALDYRFYNRVGQRIIMLKKGEVLEADLPGDVAYFRARQDVLVETTPDGTPLDQVGLVNGFNRKTTKSYKIYGRSAKLEAPAEVRSSVQIGNPNAQPVALPPTVEPLAAPPVQASLPAATHTPSPAMPSESIPVGHTRLPSEMQGPGLPTNGPAFSTARAGYESPVEVLSADGTTVVDRGPRIDPGK